MKTEDINLKDLTPEEREKAYTYPGLAHKIHQNDFELETIIDDIRIEFEKANANHPLFNSYHEGHSVIREEFEELWDEVKKRNPDRINMRLECIQIAAMCIKFIKSFELKKTR